MGADEGGCRAAVEKFPPILLATRSRSNRPRRDQKATVLTPAITGCEVKCQLPRIFA